MIRFDCRLENPSRSAMVSCFHVVSPDSPAESMSRASTARSENSRGLSSSAAFTRAITSTFAFTLHRRPRVARRATRRR